ncbi:hypothetical protein F5148DRAFT_1214939 [Russula earlei]|uniref:Uncharacterized protein n=1 Tax=Russula earlei TaxID=71964 RepID=A0ACC0U3J3_9AGAM|nr:hypothetical protein F5148DRAFT_1214939 [Russula earlei]
MAPLPPRRRVSYGVPFPPSTINIPLLWLPPLGFDRKGSVNPILIPNPVQLPKPVLQPHEHHVPRHRLGVSSLALDTTTQLVGRPSPEGILYTGGRDGLVIAWDLNIPIRRRPRIDEGMRQSGTRWELVTGWVDPVTDDPPDEDEEIRSDGDILGDVKGSSRRRALSSATATSGSTAMEYQWEPDVDSFRPGQPSTFRQAAQIHSDWVNDILLCLQDQMLVSASSDGTVKAWSPNSSPLSDPVTLGTHTDYVRCLAYSREQAWVASGSFDRTVKVWDLSRASQAGTALPVITLNLPEPSGGKGSIYALAVDPQGHMVVSGGPERVIRMWDPRAGKRIGKLVGHTDNIRAILVSEDSRCLLTASADASIKLWSLSSQRCLHTFTHHTDSVWALHSSHPSLEIFYSGDKSGLVARVDVEGCAHMSEAECVLVCQDTGPPAEGVTKLVALDDTLVWTASGSSSLRRWRAPSRRAVRAAPPVELAVSPTSHTMPRLRPSPSTDSRPRSITLDLPLSPPLHRPPRHASSMSATSPATLEPPLATISQDEGTGEGETTWFGLPYECLVHLKSPLGDPFTPFSPVYRGRGIGADADVATLYSAASLMSVAPLPLMLRAPLRGVFPSPPSPPHSPPSTGRPVSPAQSDFAPSSSGLGAGRPGNGGGGISGGIGSGISPHRAAFESREMVADAHPLSPVPDFVLVGESGLVRAALLSNRVHALTVDTAGTVAVWDIVRTVCVGQFAKEDILLAVNNIRHKNGGGSGSGGSPSHHQEVDVCSPREALDIVRERIDGEAFVAPWSSVDTAMGVLNVNVDEHAFDAELYADELGLPSDYALPTGMAPDDVRINLGKWILRNLFQGFIREEEQVHSHVGRTAPRTINNSPAAPPLPHHPSQEPPSATTIANTAGAGSVVVIARNMLPAILRNRPVGLDVLPHTHTQLSPTLVTGQPAGGDEPTTQARSQHPQPVQVTTSSTHQPPQAETTATTATQQKGQDSVTLPTRRPSVSSGGGGAAQASVLALATPDESGSSTGTGAGTGNGLTTTGTPGGGLFGKLLGLGRATKRPQNENTPGTPVPAARYPTPTATTGYGLAPQTAAATTASSSTQTPPETPAKARTAAQVVLDSGTLNPPTAADGPILPLSQDIPLTVAEERAHGWAIVYRGTLASAGTTADVAALEDAMPVWLLEYLLLGRAPQLPAVKIQFALLPGEESLPELVNANQTKLSANRFLRVRKLAAHVQERIENLGLGTPGSGTPKSSVERHKLSSETTHAGDQHEQKANHGQPRPSDLWEIVCNDTVLSPNMILAVVRQYVWRQGGEVVLHYRRKQTATAGKD